MPEPDPKLEFKGKALCYVGPKQKEWVEVQVSRPQNRISIRNQQRQFISELPQGTSQRSWMVDHEQRSYIVADRERLRQLPPDRQKRLKERWRIEGLDDYTEGLRQLLAPLNERIPQFFRRATLEKSAGPDWEGQPTLNLTYSKRKNTQGVINLPLGERVYHRLAYVPAPGIILDENGSRLWQTFELGAVAPEEFQVPSGYEERWTNEEVDETTPTSPLVDNPPAGYTAIGGTDVLEFSWREQQVIEVRQKWMQDPNPEGRYHCWVFIYYFEKPDELEDFFLTKEKWLGFEHWDQEPLVADATARVSHDRLLMKRKNCLVRMDMSWFAPNQPGKRKPPENQQTEAVFLDFAQRLSNGL